MNDRVLWIVLRCTLAGLIAAHGWGRLIAGGVAPFGQWLDAQGVPLGAAVAWGVTLLEMFGTPLLALGRFVPPLALLYAAVYATGIVLLHTKVGWFVVGLGRNGMEYSVLLIVTLGCAGWHHHRRPKEHPP